RLRRYAGVKSRDRLHRLAVCFHVAPRLREQQIAAGFEMAHAELAEIVRRRAATRDWTAAARSRQPHDLDVRKLHRLAMRIEHAAGNCASVKERYRHAIEHLASEQRERSAAVPQR